MEARKRRNDLSLIRAVIAEIKASTYQGLTSIRPKFGKDLSASSIRSFPIRLWGERREWPGRLRIHNQQSQELEMKVAVFVKATKSSKAGTLPGEQLLADMGRYNEATVNAGIMKAGEGLKPSSLGARVRFSGANRLITDGPIAEAREVLGGYYLFFARNQSECLAIASEHPGDHVGAVEVREVFDLGSTATVGKSR